MISGFDRTRHLECLLPVSQSLYFLSFFVSSVQCVACVSYFLYAPFSFYVICLMLNASSEAAERDLPCPATLNLTTWTSEDTSFLVHFIRKVLLERYLKSSIQRGAQRGKHTRRECIKQCLQWNFRIYSWVSNEGRTGDKPFREKNFNMLRSRHTLVPSRVFLFEWSKLSGRIL